MGIDNHDIGERARRIQILVRTLPLGLLFLLVTSPLVALGCFLALNLLIDRLICASGDGLIGMIYGIGQRHRSVDDLCQGDINRAKFFRRQQRYDDALVIVEQVLAREGDYPDALYLKADILWQGFADRQQAIICLNRLMENRKASKTMYNWAKSYCRRLQQLDDQNFRMPVAADSDVAMRKHVTSDRSS